MVPKNKYSLRSKISEAKIRQIVRLFAVDLDASQIAVVTRLNRNTINRYLAGIRERIASYCEAKSPVSGEVEVDESFFGARRVRGIRDAEREERLLFSVCSSVMGEYIPKSFLTAQRNASGHNSWSCGSCYHYAF